MSGGSALGSPASGGLLGLLRSWLQAWASDPSQRAAAPPAAPPTPRAHVQGSVRVLVVDDNPVNLEVVAALLEARGIVPALAADGAEAVALAGELPFDLILMDLQMPVLDGLAATSAIRRLEGTASRPAVPVIAHSNMSVDARVMAMHGINGRLGKPCEDRELEDCLVRWCPTYRSAASARGAGIGG